MFEEQQQLIDHLNADSRCEQRVAIPEGIDPTKMELIDSKWGATWKYIFEVLFPGADVPDPCEFRSLIDSSL